MNCAITVIIPTLSNASGFRYLLDYLKDKPYRVMVIDNMPEERKLESL